MNMSIEVGAVLGIMIGLTIAMFFVSLIAAAFGFLAMSKVVGFENSTHRIEYHNPQDDMNDDEEEEDLPDFEPFKIVQRESNDISEEEKKLRAKKEKYKFDDIARTAFVGGEE